MRGENEQFHSVSEEPRLMTVMPDPGGHLE
jgi:hypothetical protein